MEKVKIVRYGLPSKFDQAAYGSTCIVRDHHDSDYALYVQVGNQEEDPSWELVGIFGIRSSQEYIDQLVEMRLRK